MTIKSNDLFLGIDIGGSAFKYGWGNSETGMLVYERLNLQDNSLAAMKAASAEIMTRVDRAIGLNKIRAIGIGTPGTINSKTGKLMGVNPNLPEWTNILPESIIDLQTREGTGYRDDAFQTRKGSGYRGETQQDKSCGTRLQTSIPVFADNDANLMALAEGYLLPDKTHVIGITIGSGIGSGFVDQGHIYHGANGYAMELGHVTVVDNGESCNCNRAGCLEAYAAVNGMRNRIRAYNPNLKPVTMVDIIALSEKYPFIRQIIDEGITYLGRAIANLVICLDADAVILGGGVVELPGYPWERLKKIILDYLPEINILNLEIKKAELGNSAGVMGAIILAEQCFFTT